MKKVFVVLFILTCAFSSVCSAKGYWMAREPIARADGSYHVSDQIPLGSEGTRVWESTVGPYYMYFCLTYVMCSDDGDEIVVPIKAHNIAYKGTEYYFSLVKYKYSTRTCKYFASKYFSSSNYNVSPKENEWRNVNLVRADANFWVSPIENANKVILKQWMFMRDNQFLKRYEFVED